MPGIPGNPQPYYPPGFGGGSTSNNIPSSSQNINQKKEQARQSHGGSLITEKVYSGSTGGGVKGFVQSEASIQRETERNIRNQQADIATRKLGQIRNVVTDTARGERTFIGMGGLRYTFPINDTSFSGRNKFGGIQSRESQILVRANNKIRAYTPSSYDTMQQNEYNRRINETWNRINKIQDTSQFYSDYKKGRASAGINTLLLPGEYIDLGFVYSPTTKKTYSQLSKQEKLDASLSYFKPSALRYEEMGLGKGKAKEYAKFIPKDRSLFTVVKRLTAIPTKFVTDIGKGLANTVRAAVETPKQARAAKDLLLNVFALKKSIQKAQKKPTKQNIATMNRIAKQYQGKNKILKNAIASNKRAVDLLTREETKTFDTVIALSALGAGGAAIGGSTALLSSFGLEGLGAFFTGQQLGATIKEPTLENIGGLAFYGLTTASGIKTTLKKLGPSFRPNVKNANIVRIALKQKLEGYQKILRKSNKVFDKRILRNIKIEIPKVKRAISYLEKINKDKNILKTRDFNPKIPAKYLLKYQNAIKELYHVSGQPRINKLLGQKIDRLKLPSEKTILSRILSKAGDITKSKRVGNLGSKTLFDRIVINNFKKFKVIIGGGKAMNMQSSWFRKRATFDLDGKVLGNKAKAILERIAKQGNEIENFKAVKRYIVKACHY
jgi:hypothetical protein